MDGVELIAQERRRQIEVKGWTAEHDDAHKDSELLRAGVVFAAHAMAKQLNTNLDLAIAYWWPFRERFNPRDNVITCLVKAGALIAAEIDRLQRKD